MRMFKKALILACIFGAPSMADCPKAEDVKTALQSVIKFDDLGFLMEQALHLGNHSNIKVLNFDIKNQITLLPPSTNAAGLTFCQYQIDDQKIISFNIKKDKKMGR